jgi:hypothetical protein
LFVDETQKRITILPEKLTDENKAILKQHFKELVKVEISLKLTTVLGFLGSGSYI